MTLEHGSGQQLLLTLNSLLRTVLIHDDSNQQSIGCAANFVVAVCETNEEEFTLQISNGRFFVGDEKILHGSNNAALIHVMLDYFTQRQLAGFTFFSAIKDANQTDVLAFARLVNETLGKQDPIAWLKKKINAKKLF